MDAVGAAFRSSPLHDGRGNLVTRRFGAANDADGRARNRPLRLPRAWFGRGQQNGYGMITRHRRKSYINRIWVPLFAFVFLGYFGYHAQNGSYGLQSLERLEAEAETLRAQVDRLKAERAAIERKVAWLKPDSLDADVVDTEARTSLNLIRPDEVVISFGAVQHRP